MKKYFLFLPILITMAACSDGDFDNDDPNWKYTETIELTAAEENAVADLDVFSYNFIREVADINPGKDICCSPLSAEMYLSALANGAAGDSRSQMLETLNVSDLQTLNSLNQKLMHFLPSSKKGSYVKICNAFWVADRYDVNQEFKSSIKSVFNGVVEPVDFSKPTTVPDINKWVSKKTNGMIDGILYGDWRDYVNLPMASANTIYFKGDWSEQFKQENTKPAKFHAPEGDIDILMMYQREDLYYSEDENFQYLVKGYKGYNNHMELYLPAEGISVSEFMNLLTPEVQMNLSSSAYSCDVKLYLPTFQFNGKVPLNDVFNKMGVDMANLNLSTMGLGTESINTDQQTSIKVDEQGVEFAVVTGGGGITADIKTSVTLKFDRPFVYIIRNNTTRAILLAGIVVNPKN